VTATELFDHLLQNHEVISYKGAYTALVGPPPRPWAQADSGKVLNAAKSSGVRDFAGLPVELDTFIVSKKLGVPGDGHYISRRYNKEKWRETFGGWKPCNHFDTAESHSKPGVANLAPEIQARPPLAAVESVAPVGRPSDETARAKPGRKIFIATLVLFILLLCGGLAALLKRGPAAVAANVAQAHHPIPSAPVAGNQPGTVDRLPSSSVLQGRSIAVLEFKNHVSGYGQSASYFTDRVRGILVDVAPAAKVFTRENILVLLSGRNLADCEGECEVETARRIGADLVVSGDLRRVGATLVLSMRLHEAASARLISAASASGAKPEEIDASLDLAIQRLVRR
jgi:hypothetical protein